VECKSLNITVIIITTGSISKSFIKLRTT